jgi:hypothetical protein
MCGAFSVHGLFPCPALPTRKGKSEEQQKMLTRPNTLSQCLPNEQTIREIIGKESTIYECVQHFALI